MVILSHQADTCNQYSSHPTGSSLNEKAKTLITLLRYISIIYIQT